MNKLWPSFILLLFVSITAQAQTLFTYGNYSVSAADFLRAYNKNNAQTATTKAKAMEEYLELYINSRLKIREAYDRRYDTLPQIKAEVENLRNQIIENYMSDPETMNRLLKEALDRSKKDLHVGHIYIPIVNGDTMAAFNQANAVHTRLLKGEDFTKLAVSVSADPGVKQNKGDIGWITVFTLPYNFENAVYQLSPGKISKPVRSKSGYHIFKNIGERKALGQMKAKQILLAFPPGIDDITKKQLANKADSIYKKLVAGADFDKLATSISNDYITAVNGGSMPDFSVGQYEPEFENKVWALQRDGAFTKPFQTSHGYHIVKRIGVVPVITDPANRTNEQALRQKINQDQRWKTSREVIYGKVVKQAPLQRNNYNTTALWAYSDSLLDKRPLGAGSVINGEQTLFKVGDSTFEVKDWINYAQVYRFKPDGSGRKTYEEVMDEYLHTVALQYYRDHLELFNDDFRFQMNEFKDGNLFFEIMQQEIWNRAHTDSSQLLALYEANRGKYNWDKSADAVVFFCSDQEVAKSLYEELKKTPKKWKELTDALAEKVVADSARFEWSQIPNKNKMVPTEGMITTPVVNTTDNSTSFAYIIKVYPQPMPRSFIDAKGLVINDYQAKMEEEWIKRLRQKYPVTINRPVLEKISK